MQAAQTQIHRPRCTMLKQIHTHKTHTQDTHTQGTQGIHTHTCQYTQNAIIYYYFCVHCLFGAEKVATFQSLSLSTSTLAQKDVAVVLRTLLCQLSSARHGSTLSQSKGGGNGLRGQCAVPFLGVVSGPHTNTHPTHTHTHTYSQREAAVLP